MIIETAIQIVAFVITSLIISKGIKYVEKNYPYIPVQNIISGIAIIFIIGLLILGQYLFGLFFLLLVLYPYIKNE